MLHRPGATGCLGFRPCPDLVGPARLEESPFRASQQPLLCASPDLEPLGCKEDAGWNRDGTGNEVFRVGDVCCGLLSRHSIRNRLENGSRPLGRNAAGCIATCIGSEALPRRARCGLPIYGMGPRHYGILPARFSADMTTSISRVSMSRTTDVESVSSPMSVLI